MFPHEFHGTPSVKGAIEAIGVPHPEIDLVLADGESDRRSLLGASLASRGRSSMSR